MTVAKLIEKLPVPYGARSFITMFTKAQNWTLSRAT